MIGAMLYGADGRQDVGKAISFVLHLCWYTVDVTHSHVAPDARYTLNSRMMHILWYIGYAGRGHGACQLYKRDNHILAKMIGCPNKGRPKPIGPNFSLCRKMQDKPNGLLF